MKTQENTHNYTHISHIFLSYKWAKKAAKNKKGRSMEDNLSVNEQKYKEKRPLLWKMYFCIASKLFFFSDFAPW